MNVALYIVFALIVVLSIWSGYKHGLILSVAHLAAIVASLYLAALLSGAFSNEIVSGMRPFAEGYLDHQVATEVMPKLNLGGDNLSVADALEAKPDTAYSFCYETYRAAGIAEKPAKQMAREAQTYAAAQHTTVSDGLVHIFCEKLAFVAGTALAFILILVLLLAVGNLPNLTFRLPEHERRRRRAGGTCQRRGLLHPAVLGAAVRRHPDRPRHAGAQHRSEHSPENQHPYHRYRYLTQSPKEGLS